MRLFFVLIYISIYSSTIFSQVQCIPNPTLYYSNGWGGNPSPSDMLDTAIINEVYTQIIYFKAPQTVEDVSPNNCAPFCSWSIESVQLDIIDGLETTGMNQSDVSCNTPDCSFQGGEHGCLVIYGLPSVGGHHNLWIKMIGVADGGIWGQQTEDFTIHDYFIYVNAADANSVEENVKKSLYFTTESHGQNLLITFLPKNLNSAENINIYSIDGKTLYSSTLTNTQLNISLKKGMYVIELVDDSNSILEIKKILH